MPFVTKNFSVDQGATYTFDVVWNDSAGQPINLTGYSAKMQVRDQAGGKQLAFTLTHTDGISINGPLGKITVTISADRTNKLIYPKSFYDILLKINVLKFLEIMWLIFLAKMTVDRQIISFFWKK